MRISTYQIQQLGIDSILSQQAKLSKTQQQVATGKRVLLPSDDPVATTQMLNLKQNLETTQRYQENADAALGRLSEEDGILEGVTNILQRVRELTVQGKNASQTDETRRFIAAEVRQRLEELLGLANTKDGTGDYLFAGSKGATQPFTANAGGGYSYAGDQTRRMIQIGSGREVADGDPGSDIFQLVRNGNGVFVTEEAGNIVAPSSTNQGTAIIDAGSVSGSFSPTLTNGVNGVTLHFIQALPTDPVTWEAYATGDPGLPPTVIASGTYTDGQAITITGARFTVTGTPADGDTFEIRSSEYQDLFQTLDDLATALETGTPTAEAKATQQNVFNRVLTDLDQGLGNVLVARSSVGSRINAIESQQYVNEGHILQTTEVLSSVEDLDYAEAISRLNQQIAGLQAAQQTFIKVNGLSMFNYLK